MEIGPLRTPVWKALQNPVAWTVYLSLLRRTRAREPNGDSAGLSEGRCKWSGSWYLLPQVLRNREQAGKHSPIDPQNSWSGAHTRVCLRLLSLGGARLWAPGLRHVALATREPAGRRPGQACASGLSGARCPVPRVRVTWGRARAATHPSAFAPKPAASQPARVPRNGCFPGAHGFIRAIRWP